VSAARAVGGVEGIVNGMDTTEWNPALDKFLDVKYDAETVETGKAAAKEALQAELGLPVRSTQRGRGAWGDRLRGNAETETGASRLKGGRSGAMDAMHSCQIGTGCPILDAK
jgi:hypothetical protein